MADDLMQRQERDQRLIEKLFKQIDDLQKENNFLLKQNRELLKESKTDK